MNQLTKLLADLISIPSVNPVAAGIEDPKITGEERCAKFIADFARQCGADVRLRYELPGRPTVVCKLTARGAKRSVAFGPHTDTVSVANMTIDPFRPVIRGGRMYGRGACDTKGSCAAMLGAFARAARENLAAKTKTNILFIGLMGEESGNDGVVYYCRNEPKLDFVIVGEPTFPHVIYAHKGAFWFKVTTRGRAAHGSNPHLGDNAIEHMADVIEYLRGEYTPSLKPLRHPVLGRPTLNLGKITGGAQVNIVPDHCEMLVDHRTLPGLQSHPAIYRRLTGDLRKRGIPASIERYRDCPPLGTNPKLPLVRDFHRLARSVAPASKLDGVAYFTDAAIFAKYGSPAIVFGPGDIAQAHTKDEWIDLSHLQPAAEICYRFLERLGQG
jgi:acetylornithine deacetylase/succinyl-diaminopimelate desuccinylase-like protein